MMGVDFLLALAVCSKDRFKFPLVYLNSHAHTICTSSLGVISPAPAPAGHEEIPSKFDPDVRILVPCKSAFKNSGEAIMRLKSSELAKSHSPIQVVYYKFPSLCVHGQGQITRSYLGLLFHIEHKC